MAKQQKSVPNQKTSASNPQRTVPNVPQNAPPVPATGKADGNSLYTKIFFFGILILSAVLFLPAISPEFVNWDDDRYVAENTLLQPLSFKTLYDIFTNEVSANYNPWAIWSLAIDKQYFGLDASYYRYHNILIHVLNTALLFWLMRLLKLGNTAALIAMALFGFHTMRVESVAWVTERKDVLFGFYYILACISYIFYVQNSPSDEEEKGGSGAAKWYILTILFALMSGFSKIQGTLLPLGLIMIDYLMGRFKFDFSWNIPQFAVNFLKSKPFLEKIPFFVISLTIGLIGIHFLSKTMDAGVSIATVANAAEENKANIPMFKRIFFAPYTLCTNISKFVWPAYPNTMAACHPYPSNEINPENRVQWFAIFGSIVPFTLLCVWLWRLYANKSVYAKPILFGAGFFFVNIFTLLQVVGAGQAFLAERFTYIAYIGFFFSFAWVIEYWMKNNPASRSTYLFGTVAWLGVLGILTWNRSKVWQNSELLWSDVLKGYTFVDVAYNNRGTFYRQRMEKALDPVEKQAYADKALADFTTVLNRKPNDANVYLNRGNVYFNLGKADLAAADYDKVLAQLKDNPDVLKTEKKETLSKGIGNRGAIYFQTANAHQAKAQQAGMAGDNATAQAEMTLARADMQKAIDHFTQAISMDDKYPDAILNRGATYSVIGDRAKAKADYEKYLTFKQDNPLCYNWLALEKAYLKQYDGAIADYTSAIKLQNDAYLQANKAVAPDFLYRWGEFYFNRSQAYWGLKDKAKCKADIAKAQELGYKNFPAGYLQAVEALN